jgi:tRNA threonylcarbamoyl adenosine modification protein YeaZ
LAIELRQGNQQLATSSLVAVLVLAFDTSSPAVTVAVGVVEAEVAVDDELGSAPEGIRVLASRTEVAENRHGEQLAPLIDAVLSEAGVTVPDLAAIAVGLGPGPFTGLRVGIVTARALSDALGIPAYGESSLHLIGIGAAGVATNARRKQVYWAVRRGAQFDAGPDIGTPEQAAEHFAAAGVHKVVGEGVTIYPDVFAAFSSRPEDRYPSAVKLIARVATRVRDRTPGEDLTPLYLRRPDAHIPGKPKAVTPS